MRDFQPAMRMRSTSPPPWASHECAKVPEPVRTQPCDPRLFTTAANQLVQAELRQRPLLAKPEVLGRGVWVLGADAKVAVECHRGLPSERQCPLPSTFAEHPCDLVIEVEVADTNADHLGSTGARVDHQHDDRRVPSAGEAGAGTCGEEAAQLVVRHDRHGALRRGRRLHARHRVSSDLVFLDQPTVEHAQGTIAVESRPGGPALKQGGKELLEVLSPGLGDRTVLGSQEDRELLDGFKVVLDRPERLVLGPKVPHERAGKVGRLLPRHGRSSTQ